MPIFFESKINSCVPAQQVAYTKNKYNASVMSRSGLEISYKLAVYVKATVDEPIIVNAGILYGYVITTGQHAYYSEVGGFDIFKIGDIVQVGDYVTGTAHGNYTVINVLDDGNLLVVDASSNIDFGANSSQTQISIALNTSNMDIELANNLVSKNSEVNDENSFLNNSPEWSRCYGINSASTFYFSDFIGNKANRNTGGLRTDVSLANINSEYIHVLEGVIKWSDSSQTFLVNNWWREDEKTNIENNVSPNRYLNDRQNFLCKFRIRQSGAIFWREFIQEYETEISWFNKKEDGVTDTDFFIDGDVQISDSLTSEAQDFIAINKSTDVVFNLKSINTFTSGSDLTIPVKLNFTLLPTQDEYSNNNYTQKENFVFDDRIFAVGDTTGNGSNYGTNIQALTGIFITPSSGTEAEFLFSIDLGSLAKQKALDYENKKCLITINTYGDDETCLVIGIFDLKFVSIPGTLGTIGEYKVMRHFETDETTQGESTTPANILKEDEFWIYKKFDLSGTTYSYPDTMSIESVQQKIIARQVDTLEEFELDVVNFNTSAQSSYGGLQLFTDTQNRQFIFNEPTLKLCELKSFYTAPIDLPLWYLELRCAYQLRWEYFKQLLNVNSEFYQPSQGFNGYNQDWYHYQKLVPFPKWKIYEQTIFNFKYYETSLGDFQDYQQIDEHEIKVYDYNSNSNYTTRQITTYKINQTTLAEISDITPNILNYEKTKIKVTFENSTNLIASSSFVVIRLEAYENGGWNEIAHASSYFNTPNSVFESIDNSNKVVLTQLTVTKIKAEILINQNNLPNFSKLKLSARIYGDNGALLTEKDFEDDELFDFEDDEQYEFENL